KDFYPLPATGLQYVEQYLQIKGKIILEPSAGKGDIVDFLIDNGSEKVLACELNNELATIVKTKCQFLKHNIYDVTADEISHIDAIVMNPPFSDDEGQILHAWDIAPD